MIVARQRARCGAGRPASRRARAPPPDNTACMDPNAQRSRSRAREADAYWRRRFFALVAALGVIGLLAWACSGIAGGKPESQSSRSGQAAAVAYGSAAAGQPAGRQPGAGAGAASPASSAPAGVPGSVSPGSPFRVLRQWGCLVVSPPGCLGPFRSTRGARDRQEPRGPGRSRGRRLPGGRHRADPAGERAQLWAARPAEVPDRNRLHRRRRRAPLTSDRRPCAWWSRTGARSCGIQGPVGATRPPVSPASGGAFPSPCPWCGIGAVPSPAARPRSWLPRSVPTWPSRIAERPRAPARRSG